MSLFANGPAVIALFLAVAIVGSLAVARIVDKGLRRPHRPHAPGWVSAALSLNARHRAGWRWGR
jgi:hypothetical protein